MFEHPTVPDAYLGHLDFKIFVAETAARKKVDQDDFKKETYWKSSPV